MKNEPCNSDMILFIDTTGTESKISLRLASGEVLAEKIWPAKQNQSEELLLEIEKLLTSRGHTKEDLSGISVIVGPGSYTGIRVGVATANALALAMAIPITGFRIDAQGRAIKVDNSELYAVPYYSKPPHITKPGA